MFFFMIIFFVLLYCKSWRIHQGPALHSSCFYSGEQIAELFHLYFFFFFSYYKFDPDDDLVPALFGLSERL